MPRHEGSFSPDRSKLAALAASGLLALTLGAEQGNASESLNTKNMASRPIYQPKNTVELMQQSDIGFVKIIHGISQLKDEGYKLAKIIPTTAQNGDRIMEYAVSRPAGTDGHGKTVYDQVVAFTEQNSDLPFQIIAIHGANYAVPNISKESAAAATKIERYTDPESFIITHYIGPKTTQTAIRPNEAGYVGSHNTLIPATLGDLQMELDDSISEMLNILNPTPSPLSA